MDTPSAEPHPPFKPRHTGAQRAVLAVNIVVVIACLAGAVGLVYGKQQLDGRLQTAAAEVDTTPSTTRPVVASTAPGDTLAPTSSSGPPETFPPADPQAQNFLITGSDANACVDPGSPWANAADPARENIGSRSDSIMVMRVDPVTRQAAVLSFPRDLWVKIPGRGKNRINAAYVKDDYSLLAQTLWDNFGVPVDHYIQVDFCAFKRIVKAVGGVTIPFATPIVDANVGLDVPAGCHTFGGDEALAYVRSRHLKWVDENGVPHEDVASDLGRISRQQDFLRRVLQAALDKGLFDPAVARALIESLQTDIVTEQGFTVNDMLEFAGVLRDIDPKGIRTYQVEASRLIVSGNDVLEPKIKGDNMVAILAIFQGVAPLAGAPEQEFATTTTVSAPGDSTPGTGGSDTVPANNVATTMPATTTTVLQPTENAKGDILPDDSIICS
ncbi:MAG: LCP family protein [Actinomycetota bacterium]|nr:LCP family protein [Actinomycetota bacterium]